MAWQAAVKKLIMTIKQVQTSKTQSKKGEQQKSLLQITLPIPADMNPKSPLSDGQHNACAQKNFKQVADVSMAIINNQKLMGLAITNLDKQIKELRKNNKKISEKIGKFIKIGKFVKK